MAWRFYTKDGAEKKTPTSVVNPTAKITGSGTAFTYNSFVKNTALTTAEIDTDSMADTSNSRLVIKHSGKYLVTGSYAVSATDATGVRLGVYKNGADVGLRAGSGAQQFDAGWTPNIVGVLDLVAGDYLELYYYSNGTPGTFTLGTSLSATKVDGAVVSYVGVPGSLIGQELAYVESTTTYAPATGVLTQTIVTPSLSFDGSTAVWVEYESPHVVVVPNVTYTLTVDGTEQGHLTDMTGSFNAPLRLARRFTPPSGSHTIGVSIIGSAGGTVTDNAGVGGVGNAFPRILRVTRAG